MVLLLSLSISIIYDLSGKSMYMQSNRYSLWRISELFMKFTKEDARKRVLNCAKQYQQNLLHKKLLIIFRERQDNSIRFIEVIFHERNYQHLTGLELKGYSDFFVFQLSKTGLQHFFIFCQPCLYRQDILCNFFMLLPVYAIALPEHENKKESPAHRSCTFI